MPCSSSPTESPGVSRLPRQTDPAIQLVFLLSPVFQGGYSGRDFTRGSTLISVFETSHSIHVCKYFLALEFIVLIKLKNLYDFSVIILSGPCWAQGLS